MNNDGVSVTPLLQNGTEYNYAHADVNELNTNFKGYSSPHFLSFSNNSSSLPMNEYIRYNNWNPNETHLVSDYSYYYFVASYDPNGNYLIVDINYKNSSNVITLYQSITKLHSLYYDYDTGTLWVCNYVTSTVLDYWTFPKSVVDVYSFTIRATGTVNTQPRLSEYCLSNGTNNFVDLSAGYRLNEFGPNSDFNSSQLRLPNNPKNVLMTMDLSTITDSNYHLDFAMSTSCTLRLQKTSGSWALYWHNMDSGVLVNSSKITDLYYNSGASSNTYQIMMDKQGCDFRYVGAWPTMFGPANTYLNYEFEWEYGTPGDSTDLSAINLRNKTPVMRIDDSEYTAFEYAIIEDGGYAPRHFKNNPCTILMDPTIYGTSIGFGGHTYTVTGDHITLNGKEIPIKNIRLESVLNSDGNYDNRINGTVISTSAVPSGILFNGKWSLNVRTYSMQLTTYTHTEWKAGEFGWDGVDSNFLIVGLITCLGVFIGCGIYARKSGSGGLIPLMVVTGCAAAVFFIML